MLKAHSRVFGQLILLSDRGLIAACWVAAYGFRFCVLDSAEIPPPLAPAMFACSRVAGWSAHILEQKRTGRLFRPSARYVGPEPRSLDTA